MNSRADSVIFHRILCVVVDEHKSLGTGTMWRGASRWLSGKKKPPANAGDVGLFPGLGRCPGGGDCNPLL